MDYQTKSYSFTLKLITFFALLFQLHWLHVITTPMLEGININDVVHDNPLLTSPY